MGKDSHLFNTKFEYSRHLFAELCMVIRGYKKFMFI